MQNGQNGGVAGLPASLGFRVGTNSVHTSRTMMLAELGHVLDAASADSPAESYRSAVVDENVLGKPTRTTRERSARRLEELYALDPRCPLFRLLRHFWADKAGRPMLAFLVAAARDPLLRQVTPYVLGIPVGQPYRLDELEAALAERFPGRFRPSTLKSTAQNLASSWTQAGYLTGRVKKSRSRPVVTPAVTSFALLLGYLAGVRGRLLFDSQWARLLDRPAEEIAALAAEASRQGWLTHRSAGSVVEVTFPGLLTPQEERAAHEPD